MEAHLGCSALGLNSEVAAFSSSPSHANDVDGSYLALARNFPQGACEQLF